MFSAATKYFQGNFDVVLARLPILDLKQFSDELLWGCRDNDNLVMVLFWGGSLQQTSSAHMM
jgi:hypothetical protein